ESGMGSGLVHPKSAPPCWSAIDERRAFVMDQLVPLFGPNFPGGQRVRVRNRQWSEQTVRTKPPRPAGRKAVAGPKGGFRASRRTRWKLRPWSASGCLAEAGVPASVANDTNLTRGQ